MIPWFKGTRRIQQYAESGDFIILEVTNNMGKLYKVIQKDGGEDYKARFTGSLKKCADWANEHGANFKIFGCYESFNITTKKDLFKLPLAHHSRLLPDASDKVKRREHAVQFTRK